MMQQCFETFDGLLKSFKKKEISKRQFIFYCKSNFISDIFLKTDFLNSYSADVYERIYCVINNISSIVTCKYCGNKAAWSGRIDKGYLEICLSAECRSNQLVDSHLGKTDISSKRDSEFIQAQSIISEVNDQIIIDLIKYDKYLDLITNPVILNYLDSRFSDSYSRLETLQRIRIHIEEKPACPICGKPVKYVGKLNKMFTTYCCDKCSANSPLTNKKRKATFIEKYGVESCYNSTEYKAELKEKSGVEYHWQRQDVKEKRKKTLLEKYGTDTLYEIPGVRDKVIETCLKKYGYDSVFKSPEIREKGYETQRKNNVTMTSKAEDKIHSYLLDLGYKVERFKPYGRGSKYVSDFYLSEYDLFIEYQGSQYHHYSAYFGDEDDLKEVERLNALSEQLKRKRKNDKQTQYDRMVFIWTVQDVEKRKFIKEENINCLEIFNCKSAEDLQKQLDIYFKCVDGSCNILNNDQMNSYANDLISRRKIIQLAMKIFGIIENDLTEEHLRVAFAKIKNK